MDVLTRDNRIVGIQPAMDGPANEGALCVKGQFAYDYVHHPGPPPAPDGPECRRHAGTRYLEAGSAEGGGGFMQSAERHGRHAVYGIASGRTPTEADYMMQRFMRAGFGTHFIDNCSRA